MRVLSKDTKDFWKEVKSINVKVWVSLSSTVSGDVGYERIASIWHDHYKHLLTSSKDVSDRQFVLRQFDKITSNDFTFESYFTPNNVKEAV